MGKVPNFSGSKSVP